MFSIEEYISNRKKKDKIDEFDFQKHSENMGTIIQYVMDYFNSYLNVEDYSYEQVKKQQAVDKFKEKVKNTFPLSVDFIVGYYWQNKKRIDTFIAKAFREVKDSDLFYLPEDDITIARHVCKKLDAEMTETLINNIATASKEYRIIKVEKPRNAEMKGIDNSIVKWVKTTYDNYNVNLLDYASEISFSYYRAYVETIYSSETYYHINEYEYRYIENPFNIDAIYERNKHREFICNHKGELELLIMYSWLHNEVHDTAYWPEYVNLCASRGRIEIESRKRVLIPVRIAKIEYPCDIDANIKYVETKTGLMQKSPGDKYVLRIVYEKGNDFVWKDKNSLNTLIDHLKDSFKAYSQPELLEISSPYESPGFTKKDFCSQYRTFEKEMGHYKKMKICLVNEPTKKSKEKKPMFSTLEDVAGLYKICKELNFKLRVAIDVTYKGKTNPLVQNLSDMVNILSEIRTFIIAVHVNSIEDWHGWGHIYNDIDDHEYFGAGDKYPISGFLSGLGMIMQDNIQRYFIPSTIKTTDQLELLVDTLTRGGFYFRNREGSNEK